MRNTPSSRVAPERFNRKIAAAVPVTAPSSRRNLSRHHLERARLRESVRQPEIRSVGIGHGGRVVLVVLIGAGPACMKIVLRRGDGIGLLLRAEFRRQYLGAGVEHGAVAKTALVVIENAVARLLPDRLRRLHRRTAIDN